MDECAVCLCHVRTPKSRHVLPKCGHAFHFRCIKKWLSQGLLTCPMCRSPCVSQVRHVRRGLDKKIQAVVRTLPPPPGAYFPTFITGILSSPQVQVALDLDDDALQQLIDLAYQMHTPERFWKGVRAYSRRTKELFCVQRNRTCESC